MGEGSRCRDAIRAAGSAFTSPGISILLEVIVSGGIRSSRAPRSDPMCCALGCSPPPPRLQSPALKMLLSSSVYRQVSRRGSSYWTWGQRQGGRSILPRPTAAQPRSQRGAASAASHRTAPHGPGARSRRARHWGARREGTEPAVFPLVPPGGGAEPGEAPGHPAGVAGPQGDSVGRSGTSSGSSQCASSPDTATPAEPPLTGRGEGAAAGAPARRSARGSAPVPAPSARSVPRRTLSRGRGT